MAAEYISLSPDETDDPQIERVAKALAEGALVAMPTETVYGLAANAGLAGSVARLRAVKGRGSTQPFTAHIGRAEDCDDLVPQITTLGRRFIRKAWPGPLTLIFPVDHPAAAKVHARLSPDGAAAIYGNGSVGVRFPDHPLAVRLLTAAAAPIIASSANVGSAPPPTEAGPIRDTLADRVDYILDAGPTRYRRSSTIVAVNGDGYRLVREGVWDERTVRRFANASILFVCTGNTCRSPMAEGLCRQMLAKRFGCSIEELPQRGIQIQSAGTLGYAGGRASPEAIEVCRRMGIDITQHHARGLSPELIHPADYIFVMAAQHLEAIRAMSPADAGKAVMLDPEGDIADPMGGTVSDYEAAAATINKALEQRLTEVVL